MFHTGLTAATVFGAVVAFAGVLIVLLGGRHGRRASSVLRAPAAGERDAPAGATDAPLVRLEGAVDLVPDGGARREAPRSSSSRSGGEPIEAPFSGTPSVVVRHVVEERQLGTALLLIPWSVTIHEDAASTPFQVRTPAATATVEGSVGTAVLDAERVATVGPDESPPDRILAFDAEAGLGDRRSPLASLPGPLAGLGRAVGLGRRTYSEERLEPGDEATVVGYPLGDDTVDPLVVSDRSPRRTFLAMARTGLVAVAIGLGTLAVGALVLLA